MKEYNWREERKKYQSINKEPENTAPVQNTPAAHVPVKNSSSKTAYIIGAIAVLVVIAVFCAVLGKNKDTVSFEKTVTDGNGTVATTKIIREKTSSPAVNITLSSPSSGKSFEELAEEKKYAVGLVTLYISYNNVLHEKVPVGTAWAFAPNKYATNAHVVNNVYEAYNDRIVSYVINNLPKLKGMQDFDALLAKYGQNETRRMAMAYLAETKKRYSLSARIIVNQKNMISHRVVALQAHPSYNNTSHSPDVAIMVIEGTNESYFNLASKQKLYNLKSGRSVAFLGFPMESLQYNNVNNDNPVATFQAGKITAVSDFDMKQNLPEHCYWIRHSIPSAGGASGSAIFDEEGDVLALHNSGSYYKYLVNNTRIATSAQVNGAVRVDMLEGIKNVVPFKQWLQRGNTPEELLPIFIQLRKTELAKKNIKVAE